VRRESRNIILLNVVTNAGVLLFWMYYGEIIPICIFLYHIATDIQSLWYPYIPILVGAIAGMILSKYVSE
jgi:hypothetical protein